MKILLSILLLISIISILGMFYWMYKAKKGTLELSTNSWHYKLKHWMWDFETWEGKNACPYYWGLVFSILILPLYCIILSVTKIWERVPKLPKINVIPKTKKEAYKKIYSNSKNWLKNIFFGVLIMFVLGFLILSFYHLFTFNLKVFIILISYIVYMVLVLLQSIFKPEWDEYHNDHWVNLFNSVFGLFSLPFIIIFKIFELIFSKIGNFYTNICSPIEWNKD